jgi:hypothetical protein
MGKAEKEERESVGALERWGAPCLRTLLRPGTAALRGKERVIEL